MAGSSTKANVLPSIERESIANMMISIMKSYVVDYFSKEIMLQFIALSRRTTAQIVLANRDIHQQQLYFI
jgi:hypothetical protein